MTHSEIAKKVELKSWQTYDTYYWIYYSFGRNKINFRLEKDSESDLLALVEGEMCQFEALSIAILNEVQKEAAAVAHRSEKAVNNVPDIFNEIFQKHGLTK